MKKFKTWKKIVLSISIVAIAIVGSAMVLLYNVGDRILSEMILSELSNASFLNEITENNIPLETKEQTKGEIASPKNSTDKPVEGIGNQTQPTQETKKPTIIEPKPERVEQTPEMIEPKPEQVVPNPEQVEPKPTPAPPNITTEQIGDVKNQVSAIDKIVAAELVVKRLTSDDISKLNQIMAGGLTPDEKEQAKDIALERFSEAELEKIKAMYKKYMGK